MGLFRFLKRLVVMTRNGIGKVLIHIGFARQHGHDGEILIAGRAEWPEPLYIRNRHNLNILAKSHRLLRAASPPELSQSLQGSPFDAGENSHTSSGRSSCEMTAKRLERIYLEVIRWVHRQQCRYW